MGSRSSKDGSAGASAARFATTRWTMILQAGQRRSPDADRALESLCRAYWYPLYAYARRRGYAAEEFTLTGTHQVMGTPRYMAPEQMEGSHAVDHRADIYSLGVVFYEMLTGELPMGRFEPPSKKVEVDVRLDEVVLRSLAKEPERRYQQASEVKTDVELVSSTHDSHVGSEADSCGSADTRVHPPQVLQSAAPPSHRPLTFGQRIVLALGLCLALLMILLPPWTLEFSGGQTRQYYCLIFTPPDAYFSTNTGVEQPQSQQIAFGMLALQFLAAGMLIGGLYWMVSPPRERRQPLSAEMLGWFALMALPLLLTLGPWAFSRIMSSVDDRPNHAAQRSITDEMMEAAARGHQRRHIRLSPDA